MMSRIEYFTLAEVAEQTNDPVTTLSWQQLINDCLMEEEGHFPVINRIYTEQANTLLQQYIWPRYFDKYVASVEGEVTNENWVLTKMKLASKLYNFLAASSERWSRIISDYEANKTKLLETIKSKSVSRFNDTPQTTTQGVLDESYTTTATINENEADPGTMAGRLKEVQKFIDDFYSNWAKEFNNLVIYW